MAVLDNGDIVTGSSDAIVRVFTCDETRHASVEEIKMFEECVSSQAIPAAANLDLGEIKVDQLPGILWFVCWGQLVSTRRIH